MSTWGLCVCLTTSLGKNSLRSVLLINHFCPGHSSPTLTTTHVTYGKRKQDVLHLCVNQEHGEGRGAFRGQLPGGEYTMNHRNSECLWHQSVNAQQSRSNQWPATDVYYSATLNTVRLIILLEHKNSFRKYKNLKHCPHVFYKNKMNNFLTLK